MTEKELITTFHEDAVSGIDPYTFNYGGCLYLAFAFHEWLKMHNAETKTFRLVQYDWQGKWDILANAEFIRGNNEAAKSSHHFSWKWKGIEMDAHGTEHDNMEKMHDKLEKKVWWELNSAKRVREFCESALMHGGWNSTFDRSYARDRISENVGLNLPLFAY